jgi:hypothetical protein
MIDPAKAGDMRVEIEFTLPADQTETTASLVVTTPQGDCPPVPFRILDSHSTIAEKEPNGGFASAQPVKVPQTITGVIGDAGDVDVFGFSGKAGQKISAEVFSARYGSLLDSLLTLYDKQGNVIATNDDSESGADSLLQVKLPFDGDYLLALTDANSLGSAVHSYLLRLSEEK